MSDRAVSKTTGQAVPLKDRTLIAERANKADRTEREHQQSVSLYRRDEAKAWGKKDRASR